MKQRPLTYHAAGEHVEVNRRDAVRTLPGHPADVRRAAAPETRCRTRRRWRLFKNREMRRNDNKMFLINSYSCVWKKIQHVCNRTRRKEKVVFRVRHFYICVSHLHVRFYSTEGNPQGENAKALLVSVSQFIITCALMPFHPVIFSRCQEQPWE